MLNASRNSGLRMLLVGAGAVGESIVKILQWRDRITHFLEKVVITDYEEARAAEVKEMMGGDPRFTARRLDATDREAIAQMIREEDLNFVMDAAPPFASNPIFDAAYAAGADYANMGTWSVPMEDPAYGLGIENSYVEPMTK